MITRRQFTGRVTLFVTNMNANKLLHELAIPLRPTPVGELTRHHTLPCSPLFFAFKDLNSVVASCQSRRFGSYFFDTFYCTIKKSFCRFGLDSFLFLSDQVDKFIAIKCKQHITQCLTVSEV